jgi:hypothetical protein
MFTGKWQLKYCFIPKHINITSQQGWYNGMSYRRKKTEVLSYSVTLFGNSKQTYRQTKWQRGYRQTDGRTYSQYGTYVTFPLIFLAIFNHTRLKKRHTSKNGMNRIRENLLLPIVSQVTQVPFRLYGQADIQTVKGNTDRYTIVSKLHLDVMCWCIQ